MKIAWRDRWGGPEVMELRDVETPSPTGDQVLVRVHASSVNRADLDWMLPKGGWFARVFLGLRRPRRHSLGIDVAGAVEALGRTRKASSPATASSATCSGEGWRPSPSTPARRSEPSS